jgi:alpha-D-ribose 1-methylphosphonate 5-triphosphate synthase subunit PhnI
VIGEDGKEYEVKQVEAVAAVASTNRLDKELPPDAAKQIEQAMVWAINKAMEDGVSDPTEINARMMKARADMKQSMYTRMNDLRSQEAAAAKEK